METTTELIILAVSVIITVIVITVALMLANSAKEIPNNTAQQLNSTNDSIESWQYTKYCEDDCDGNEVLAALRKFNTDSVGVGVKIKYASSGTPSAAENMVFCNSSYVTLNGGNHGFFEEQDWSTFQNLPVNDYSVAKDIRKLYINPISKFNAKVTKNENGTIKNLVFTEEKYTAISDAQPAEYYLDTSKTYSGTEVLQGLSTLQDAGYTAGVGVRLGPDSWPDFAFSSCQSGKTKILYSFRYSENWQRSYFQGMGGAGVIGDVSKNAWSTFTNSVSNAYYNKRARADFYIPPNAKFKVITAGWQDNPANKPAGAKEGYYFEQQAWVDINDTSEQSSDSKVSTYTAKKVPDATMDPADTDLDVLFSDGDKDTTENSETTEEKTLNKFKDDLGKIQKKFDEVSAKISAVDADTTISAMKEYKKLLNELQDSLKELRTKYCNSDSLSGENLNSTAKSITVLDTSLQDAEDCLDELIKIH